MIIQATTYENLIAQIRQKIPSLDEFQLIFKPPQHPGSQPVIVNSEWRFKLLKNFSGKD